MKTKWSDRVEQLDRLWGEPGCVYYRKTLRDKIVELMKPTEKLLDVGCGNSVLYDHLPPELKKAYTGVDFTPEFIELCRERYPEGDWRVEDARDISFPDSSFYLVNSTTVLQHINEWRKAAGELVRVAGRYVISTSRTHYAKTSIFTTNPVLRRRFNPQDIVDFYSQYGKVEWRWVRWINGKKLLGMYILNKERKE